MKNENQQIYGFLFVLTLAMIFDAVFQSNSRDNFVLYGLNIFTIPVFIGLMGTLRSYESYKKKNFIKWITRWTKFLIIYLVIIMIYSFLINWQFIQNVGVRFYLSEYYIIDIKDRLIDPYFRLSILLIIPLFEFFTLLSNYLKISLKRYLMISIIISFIALSILVLPSGQIFISENITRILIESTFRIQYLIFFTLGVLIHSSQAVINKNEIKKVSLISLILLTLSSLLFFSNQYNFLTEWEIFFSINGLLLVRNIMNLITSLFILLTLYYSALYFIIFKSFMIVLGRYSLNIIAWYGLAVVVSFNVTYQYIIENEYTLFYLISTLILLVIGLIHYYLRNIKWVNAYLIIKL